MLSTLFYTLQTLRPNNRSYVPDLLRDRTAVFLHRNDESPDRNGFLRVFLIERIRLRNGRKQCLGVRMKRILK